MSKNIALHVLGSGSKGNACLVECNNTLILIDCGLSYRQLTVRTQTLGLDLNDVSALFITHEHADHTSAIDLFAKKHTVPIFCTPGTARGIKSKTPISYEQISNSERIVIGDLTIQTFPTSHDVIDPIGFRIETLDDALGYCTDTGVLTQKARESLSGVRILALESNHDLALLVQSNYPAHLKARIKSSEGHLSNAQAKEYLKEIADARLDWVVGMHLSQENNLPNKAVQELSDALGARPTNSTYTEAFCEKMQTFVTCASQTTPRSFR